ncbi:hypothetical protein M758_5G075200 [Ceratodon purpureus]|nr:hypothetical protein M758_5G075200 [Ceratodon purpureus]
MKRRLLLYQTLMMLSFALTLGKMKEEDRVMDMDMRIYGLQRTMTAWSMNGKCDSSATSREACFVNFSELVVIRIAEGTASTLLLRTQRILANRQVRPCC